MNGLHPSVAGCTVVAIEFRKGEPIMVRLRDARGVEMLVTANMALMGSTLDEVLRLSAPRLRRVK